MTPRLSRSGYATIYLILPPGSFANESRYATERLEKKRRDRDPFQGIVSEKPEILYLLGQARFAARVEAKDYRSVLDRAYPDSASKALVSNAVFSIPFESEPGVTFEHSRNDKGVLRFLTHLRVRRTIYKRNPVLAETLIIDRLRQVLKTLNSEFTIEAGLGWADFIVSGVVHPKKFNDFLKNLVEFNRVFINDPAIADHDCVFRRSLTLFGYPWTKANNAPTVGGNPKALMFIRARPGRLSRVEKLTKERFPGSVVEFVDGKIDVIVSTPPPEEGDFFRQHELLSEGPGRQSIEKFETHIVFGSTLFEDWKDETGREDDSRTGDCGCRSVDRPPCEIEALPERLRNAVSNIQFLFAATLSDPANCCDARNAILACEASLRTLIIQLHKEKVESLEAQLPDAARRSNETSVQILKRIDRWVRTAERILRQRTVGSFEEFLGQSDRAVSYRGGAQKVLAVADNLMNDFYAKIRKKPWEACLTALYDSADGVEIIVGTGFVRLPVRALFFLPGVVPDLWHEVGSFHFFKELDAERSLHLNLDDPIDQDLNKDLADHYGDLISFIYGFKLDREQFVTALAEGWLASQAHKDIPQSVLEESYLHILVRMTAVIEFLVAKGTQQRNRYAFLSGCCDEVFRIVEKYDSKKIPRSAEESRDQVCTLLEEPRLLAGLNFIRSKIEKKDVEVPSSIDDPAFDFGKPAPLPSFAGKDDMNDAFRQLYWAVIEKRIATRRATRKDGTNAFALTAALTRGAALEYYRRAAARDEHRIKTQLARR